MSTPEKRQPKRPSSWLVGDDLKGMRGLYRQALTAYEIRVKTVKDPDELLEAYQKEQRRYEFVLTDYDYGRGERNGLYVARRLLAITEAPLPIAMSSGHVFSPNQQMELDKVMSLILPKPVRVSVMFAAIEKSAKVQSLLLARQQFYSSG